MGDNCFQAAYGGSFLNHQFLVSAAAPVYPNAPSSLQPMLDANGQLALDKNGKIIQDGNITPIGAPFQSAPGQTFDQNCAVNTIYSANLTPVNSNPNSNGLLPSQNDSNPLDDMANSSVRAKMIGPSPSFGTCSGGWTSIVIPVHMAVTPSLFDDPSADVSIPHRKESPYTLSTGLFRCFGGG